MAKQNQKGFSAVEALLFIVLIAIVGGVAYYVGHASKNANKTLSVASQESSSNSTSSALTANWKTFSSSIYMFKYPSDWTATAPGNQIAFPSDVEIDSPQANQVYYKLSGETVKPKIAFNFYSNNVDPLDCSGDNTCTVQVATPLKIAGLKNPKLLTIGLTAANDPSYNEALLQVVDDASAKVGDTSPADHFTLNGKDYQLEGCIRYVGGSSVAQDFACGGISSYKAWQQSANYQDIVRTLDTITIK